MSRHRPLRSRTVHVVGAGLAGLSAAVDLASRGICVAVHEATSQAGGRCRSYLDSTLGMEIDNGNHLVLSGNRATLAYLDAIGARARLSAPSSASFPFVDLQTGERWTVHANDGPIPWWILDPKRRTPGARLPEYLALARLLRARSRRDDRGDDFVRGTALRAPDRTLPHVRAQHRRAEGSAALAASVIRETLAAGGRNYHPLIARDGLSAAFVDPALRYIEARGGSVTLAAGCARSASIPIERRSSISAMRRSPWRRTRALSSRFPQAAGELVPGLSTPTQFRAIVNAHYRIEPPAGLAPMIGVVHGLAQWLFAFPGRLSVTISAADHLLETPSGGTRRANLAGRRRRGGHCGADAGVANRARTARHFRGLAGEEAKRPAAETAWTNLVLAGDWTRTGLPATIEGAIRPA